jgi:hypothetical protein
MQDKVEDSAVAARIEELGGLCHSNGSASRFAGYDVR